MIARPLRSPLLSIIGGAILGSALNFMGSDHPSSTGNEGNGSADRPHSRNPGQSPPPTWNHGNTDQKIGDAIARELQTLSGQPESEAQSEAMRTRFAALYRRNPAMAFSIIDALPPADRATALMKLTGPSMRGQRAYCANEALKRGYFIGSNDSQAVKSLMQDAAAQNFNEYMAWLQEALQSDHSESVADHFAYPLPPKPAEIAGLLNVYLGHLMNSGTPGKSLREVLVFAPLVPAEQLSPILADHLKKEGLPIAGREALLAQFSTILAAHEPGVANEIARSHPMASKHATQLLADLAAAGTLEESTVDHLRSNGRFSDAQQAAVARGQLINSLKTGGNWKAALQSIDVTPESAPWITQQLASHHVSPADLLATAQSTPGTSGDLLQEAYIDAWAKLDVVGASAQLALLPHPADGAVMAVTREIESDPAAAFLWSRKLSDGSTRTRECERFLALLAQTDPAAAKQLRDEFPVEP